MCKVDSDTHLERHPIQQVANPLLAGLLKTRACIDISPKSGKVATRVDGRNSEPVGQLRDASCWAWDSTHVFEVTEGISRDV